MSDQVQEILEIPSDFAKEGIQFMRRCTKRQSSHSPPSFTQTLSIYPRFSSFSPSSILWLPSIYVVFPSILRTRSAGADLQRPADQKEFLRLCQAVGLGFLVMGAVGYFVKLIHIPVNNILVGAA